jgi:hypothetical protein
VESDVRSSSHERSEGHGIPGVEADHVLHVLASVDIEVVNGVEDSEGSVKGPAHVSRVEHNAHLGVFGHKNILFIIGDEHAGLVTHITFNYKNIIKECLLADLNRLKTRYQILSQLLTST